MNEPRCRAHPPEPGGDCVNLDLVPAAINSGVARVRVQHDVWPQHTAVYGLKCSIWRETVFKSIWKIDLSLNGSKFMLFCRNLKWTLLYILQNMSLYLSESLVPHFFEDLEQPPGEFVHLDGLR